MNSYKNLIKHHNSLGLILSIIFGILGLLLIITLIHPVIMIIGLIIAFFGFYYVPKNAYGSRDQEKYYAEENNGMVTIKYDKYIFEFPTGRCNPFKFLISKNGFVSFFMWYPIYEDFLKHGYNVINECKKANETFDVNTITRSEISIFLGNVEEINDSERKILLDKIGNNAIPFNLNYENLKGILWRVGILFVIAIISSIWFGRIVMFQQLLVFVIIILIIFLIIYLKNRFNKTVLILKNKKIYRFRALIKDREAYKVNKNGGYIEKYHVKVWDGEHTLSEWIDVSKGAYENANGIYVYVSEKRGEYYLGSID